MRHDPEFDDLWDSAETGEPISSAELEPLPSPARRYLEHALTIGEPRASAVRLSMHGTLRLKDRWDPFVGDQVIAAGRGFVWRAALRMRGLRVSGSDRFIDGRGAVRWKLFGLLPVANASGPDIARSSAGRVAIEQLWLPTAWLDSVERWEPIDDTRCAAHVSVGEFRSRVELEIDELGGLRTARMQRYGNPDGIKSVFREESFGCIVEAERRFGALTIPSRVRVGWYFGTPRFEASGEFFRCEVDDAEVPNQVHRRSVELIRQRSASTLATQLSCSAIFPAGAPQQRVRTLRQVPIQLAQ